MTSSPPPAMEPSSPLTSSSSPASPSRLMAPACSTSLSRSKGSNDGVSNCYVFKSQLQEYAQKVGLATPVYETIKEGPSHEPSFRSTLILNDVRYDSLLGFTNRKASEQSAAEVALRELAKSGNLDQGISQPVHESGLCKNILQEYVQKMNYAIPTYQCQKEEKPGRTPLFSCTAQIGGIQYIGAAAKTKKEAEIKAARTALLAIQSIGGGFSEKPDSISQLTVLPCKRKEVKSAQDHEETPKPLKPCKRIFKKRRFNRRFNRTRGSDCREVMVGHWKGEMMNADQNVVTGETSVPCNDSSFQDGQLFTSNQSQSNHPDSFISALLIDSAQAASSATISEEKLQV